jgi:hypothetical protein
MTRTRIAKAKKQQLKYPSAHAKVDTSPLLRIFDFRHPEYSDTTADKPTKLTEAVCHSGWDG